MDIYLGDLITGQRHDTRNVDTEAHSNDQFVRYNNYAQSRLFGLITLSHNWLFEETIEADIVANQDTYEVNDNLSFGTRITNVEYSRTGLSSGYTPMEVTPDRYQTLTGGKYPVYWRRRHGKVVIEPSPTVAQGKLRITYERALDRLALRTAQINGTPSGTSIALDNIDSALEAQITANAFICISDINGTPLLYNGVVSSYSSPNITLTANVSEYLQTGVALADLDNAFLTVGKYTTTHSKLPNEAEGFFNEWVNAKLHNIDSSDQFNETSELVRNIRDTMVAALKMPDKARKVFPVVDEDLMIPGFE